MPIISSSQFGNPHTVYTGAGLYEWALIMRRWGGGLLVSTHGDTGRYLYFLGVGSRERTKAQLPKAALPPPCSLSVTKTVSDTVAVTLPCYCFLVQVTEVPVLVRVCPSALMVYV